MTEMLLLTIINILVVGLGIAINLKLYTEFFKERVKKP